MQASLDHAWRTPVPERRFQRWLRGLAILATLSLAGCHCHYTVEHRVSIRRGWHLPPFEHAVDSGALAAGDENAADPRSGRKVADDRSAGTLEGPTRISFGSEGADFDPEVDPTGTWILYASTQHAVAPDIYRRRIGGHTQVRLTLDDADDVMPTLSPDGRSILFASNRGGNWDLWMTAFEGGAPTRLTSEPDHELHPSISPDGSTIAYCRENRRTGRWEIWTFELARPGLRTYVCDGLFPQWCPDPDRRTLLFQCPRDRGGRLYGLWTIDLTDGPGGSPVEILSASDTAAMHPAWSPDGRSICYCSVPIPEDPARWLEESDIWTIRADGTERRPLTDNRFRGIQPTWSVDGRVFYVSDRAGADGLWSIPAGVPTSDEAGLLAGVGDDDPAE